MAEYMTLKEIAELTGKGYSTLAAEAKELGFTENGKETRLNEEQCYELLFQFLSRKEFTQICQKFYLLKIREGRISDIFNDVDIATAYITLLDKIFCTNYDNLNSVQKRTIISLLENTMKLFGIERNTKLNDAKSIKEGLLNKAREYKLRAEHCIPEEDNLPLLIQEIIGDK